MAEITYPSNVIEQARTMLRVWRETRPTEKFADLTADEFELLAVAAETERDGLESINAQADLKRDLRDASYGKLWSYVVRGKSGFKSTFGDNSMEYERVGGTRRSNRKKPERKPKSPPNASAPATPAA